MTRIADNPTIAREVEATLKSHRAREEFEITLHYLELLVADFSEQKADVRNMG